LLRLQGFAGLRDGCRVIEGLVRLFWEHVHPQPDDDGLSARVAPIAGLNGEGGEGVLIAPIRLVPLVTSDAGTFAFWHYERAAKAERITPAAVKEAAIADAGFSLATIETALQSMQPTAAGALLEDLAGARDAAAAVAEALEEAAGPEAPSTDQIVAILDEVIDVLCGLGFEGGADVEPDAGARGSATTDEPSRGAGCSAASARGEARWASREEAIAEILAIARYLRSVEPHSPISYTLQEVVRRANLSLIELLPELVPDRHARRQFLTAAGIHVVDDAED